MLLGLSSAGIGTFGVVALMSGYDVSFRPPYCADGVSSGQRGWRAGRRPFSPTDPASRASCRRLFCTHAVIVFVIATVALPSLLLTAAMASPASSAA